ncbi:MAG: adenosine deaminase [Lachnospiraceae bacterium]|nr:adenosine deaminase [Lachnospiraceae bacterium]MCH4030118.1 adenosine deaminase [Lachnospiraceae bacterium]MCH4070228.1 adenosine deaminase [Lachnospiraceae bacterium]MCH4107734.1 adenosine deaminase [Lachnospiraceae bacterium]MCI1301415.1 adenosine deaminase [Lachnospiraceae bacterium]
MTYFTCFYLDNEKDIIVSLYKDLEHLYYELETPNHNSGNLIRNLAKLCGLPLASNENGLLVIRGEVPCYIDGNNEEVYVFRMGGTKVANIYPDGRVEMKAAIPAIAKTLMSQTRDYRLDVGKTIFKTYIARERKFRSDLHTHMNGNLPPDVLIALGIRHQIRYPLYYVRKLNLTLTDSQEERLRLQREKVAKQFVSSGLSGKYLDRKINDNTFINFADLILNNLNNAEENIVKIRTSLAILKDGQAVFTNLEKVYLYRYVFTKGQESEDKIRLNQTESLPDADVRRYLRQMLVDAENPDYCHNTVFQDDLLWIARGYKRHGIEYAEISDTTLVKKYESIEMLKAVHEVMPKIYRETGVMIRFLAALRRIPLTIVKDRVTPEDYLRRNLIALSAVAPDPYVAGCDFVGEEINDIITLKPVFREIVKIAAKDPTFVIRVHAGENDSQKENIAHSIACVRDNLAPGQMMPRMRLGHGLYMHSLKSRKGQEVLEQLRRYGIVLEFQLSSNVRLNNLNSLDNHPLRQYLREGIACVQGTDGAALYGTNPIDEQLALEKLLGLTDEEESQMKRAETEVIRQSREEYSAKKRKFEEMLGGRDMEEVLLARMEQAEESEGITLHRSHRLDATSELKDQIRELPWDRTPVVLMGGSFNTEKRTTHITREGTEFIDRLLDELNPDEVFFAVGDRVSGYEKYLIDHNTRNFRIFAFVPSLITRAQEKKLKDAGVFIRVSTESESMGLYKSFNYEIFERRPSVVIGLDGNSAGANLMQEAKNGKGKAAICIWSRCAALREKAASLEGYVQFFDKEHPLKPAELIGQ